MLRSSHVALMGVLVLSACLATAELGRRILDGYRIWSPALVRNLDSTDLTWSNGRSTEALLKAIPVDLESDSAWFYDRPTPILGTEPDSAVRRRLTFGPEANYVWNAEVIKRPELKAVIQKPGARLDEVFVFHSPDGQPYPQYRFYPSIQTGIGLTNRFGWRSQEIAPDKPPRTIRIGF